MNSIEIHAINFDGNIVRKYRLNYCDTEANLYYLIINNKKYYIENDKLISLEKQMCIDKINNDIHIESIENL